MVQLGEHWAHMAGEQLTVSALADQLGLAFGLQRTANAEAEIGPVSAKVAEAPATVPALSR